MTVEIGIVLAVVGIMLLCLIKEAAKPEVILLVTLAVLLLLGVMEPAEALRGFSNEGMLTVGLLFIVAGAVQQGNALNYLVKMALGSGNGRKKSLIQMMFPVAGLSAFLNNTPIVVMFTPLIRKWCRERGIAPSKFLIPLSYAAIFGGTLTLIGTSTNLVIHGFMLEQGMEGFSMFQLAVVGLPAGLIGVLYMSTVGYRILPDRRTSTEAFSESSKEYLSQAFVEKGSPLAGKTVEEAGLRRMEGFFLIELIRRGNRSAPVAPTDVLEENDRLIFTGSFTTLVDLQNIKGLQLETGTDLKLEELQNGNAHLLEAVVSHRSPLAGRTLKESCFRTVYDAGVVAIHRNEERVKEKIGDTELKPGDTLLLLADGDFLHRWNNTKDFYLLSEVTKPDIVHSRKALISLVTLILMITLAATGLLSMFEAAVLAVLTLFVTNSISLEKTRRFIQVDVLLVIASAIGIGMALEQSGTASFIASHLVQISSGIGVIGALTAVYFLTSFFTEIITNNAAAVLMFPIAFAIAEQLGYDPTGFFVAIAIAASASFATPIGYQTNLIVYGPGGYRFSDYVKVGIPLNILYLIVTVSIVQFVWLG
ncbi:SLC13 family permease [Alkalicoccus saliphilus]|jgi:di/tricarboxylate transporter|uniref:SLC13 family permease n=1 Tax=Alkalicoccus saliphilus TaxID=200989 RepID=A0A2T4U5X6_9BACI|nr:SLC13 family permease [Alkalicoccus saliphilus]PTL38811.1 SLC13 family permease [Alkalicoccus saliphilus]